MNNANFLQYYQMLQYSIMGDKLINLDFASITLNNTSQSFYWNHAFTDRILNKDEINLISKILKQ